MSQEQTERMPIDPSEMDSPIQKNSAPPLEFFPEREWLAAIIYKVEYRYVYRNGQMQYLQNKDKEDVEDKDGNRIPRKEFNITMLLRDYNLPNGDPRKAWLSVGASMGEKAHLPQVLFNCGFSAEDPTPGAIVEYLEGKEVKFQVANRTRQRDGAPYQSVIWDTLRLLPKDASLKNVASIAAPAPERFDKDGNPIAWDE